MDLGSVNGTYLNGTRVLLPAPLQDGARIRIGDTEILFARGNCSFAEPRQKSPEPFGPACRPQIGRPVASVTEPEQIARRQKSRFERVVLSILGSRFLVVSTLIHLLIVVLIGGRVLFNKYLEPPDFQSAGETVPLESPPAPPPDATLPPAETASMTGPPPPPSTSLAALETLSPVATTFSVPVPAVPPP